MKITKTLVLFLLAAGFLCAQGRFASFLEHVDTLNYIDKAPAVDSFMTFARTQGIPFVDNDTATYLYVGSVNKVQIAGDVNGWASNGDEFDRVSGTNLFYLRHHYEMNARLDYKLIVNNSDWILDPENPNQTPGGYGPNSELAMPEYVQPWEIEQYPDVPGGTLDQFNIVSTVLNRNFKVFVYLPPGYEDNPNTQYPAVYFQDGSDYLGLGRVRQVFDNLIDSLKIPPSLAFLVVPNNRTVEYTQADRFKYAEFFSTQLVDYVDSAYRTISDKNHRVVIGDSFGGNISAIISWNYPEVFRKAGLHSAAFWPNNYEVYNMIAGAPKKDIMIYANWGTYEGLFENLRNFRDSLTAKGYEFRWAEYPEGHSWGLWRATIDDMLTYFFDGVTTPVENSDNIIADNHHLFSNYPNPFNPSTKIAFYLKDRDFVKINVYSVTGEKIALLTERYYNKGYHNVSFNAGNLNSGVYFYTLEAGKALFTGKMMLLK